MILDTDISYLKGVGPQRAALLAKELDITTFGDLLMHLPFRYIDRSKVSVIASADANAHHVVVRGKVRNVQMLGTGRAQRLTAELYDHTGVIELVWFQGIKWMSEYLKPNIEYLVMGKMTLYGYTRQMSHPDMEPLSTDSENQNHSYIPVYSTTTKLTAKGVTSKAICKMMDTLLRTVGVNIPEVLPADMLQRLALASRPMAMHAIHFPANTTSLSAATRRLKFDELFFLQLDHQYHRNQRQRQNTGQQLSRVGDHFNTFYNTKLPFALTGAQQRVVREIWTDMRSGRQMNRLLQGDVGSGKTMVALLTMLLAIDNGCQVCLMAPTEILAQQHYDTFSRLLDGMPLCIELLIGSVSAAKKRKIKQALANGEIHIIVGTHALLSDDVVFRNLGYAVIDEQHRFGVEQRSKLWAKSTTPPHILVMTATPIPRTLAMTLYSDLDCSIIDELPPGRQPVKTSHGTDAQRLKLFAFMRQQIEQGRQVYVVYPLIQESEKLDIKDLMDGYESITRSFPLPQYQVSIVHGKMDADAKNYEMDRFKRGITNIMVSTTVIEVGVDVPNATVMVIENAERFGLSQLHQLRGRVGRGGGDSYCILMTSDELSYTGQQRIQTMCSTTDGFKIAEADLRLRGPGDLEGRSQSGMLDLKIADLVEDVDILEAARREAFNIIDIDPDLQLPQHHLLRKYVLRKGNKTNWGVIS